MEVQVVHAHFQTSMVAACRRCCVSEQKVVAFRFDKASVPMAVLQATETFQGDATTNGPSGHHRHLGLAARCRE